MFYTITKKNFLQTAALFLLSLVLVNNAFYGFGWSDEALYTATVHSLYEGKRLFFDISEPTQCYSVLLLPIYSIFMKLTGGDTSGVYLFMRLATILFQLVTSVVSYFILKSKFSKSVAFTSSAVLLVYSRAELFGPSYYTFCLLNFALACDLLFCYFQVNQKKICLFLAGIFFGFSILCNPFLAVPYILFSLLGVIFRSPRKHIKSYLLVWAGTLLVGALFIGYVFSKAPLKDFPLALKLFFSSPEYTYSDPSRTTILKIKKLLKFPRLLVTQFVYFLPFSALAVVLNFNSGLKEKIRSSTRTRIILFLLMVVNYIIEILFIRKDNGMPVTGFFAFAVLFYFIFVFKEWADWKKYKADILFFLIPGLTLSFAECIASDTGFGVFSIGIVICVPFAAHIYADSVQVQSGSAMRRILYAVPVLLLVFGTLYYRINITYRDKRISPHFLFIPRIEKGISRIESGPAKFLWTENSSKEQYDSILKTVSGISYSGGRMYKSFMLLELCPWAYLANTSLSPFAMTAWRLSADDKRLQTYFEEMHHELPDYVLVLNKNIRQNDDDFAEETFYLMRILKENRYAAKQTECGCLYERLP